MSLKGQGQSRVQSSLSTQVPITSCFSTRGSGQLSCSEPRLPCVQNGHNSGVPLLDSYGDEILWRLEMMSQEASFVKSLVKAKVLVT